jgi:hypothetical protein
MDRQGQRQLIVMQARLSLRESFSSINDKEGANGLLELPLIKLLCNIRNFEQHVVASRQINLVKGLHAIPSRTKL